MDINIVPLMPDHRSDWDRLYAGYAAFYKVNQTGAMRDRVWTWLHDPEADTEGLIALNEAGHGVGLTHFAPLTRPLHAATAALLNDLFVDPVHRGHGVADALIAAVCNVARQRGWSAVRWLTAEDNYRARGLYDKLATKTPFLTYEIKL